ncbi:DctP family TRAP transporter solute-binding subunit [Ureibacillus aquaedulcis]|uniref:DctP family TRAP transporter solute-binding subunit n=1 Tax=Ureibacillus aquaedulcis TaxID=3058421 RepID=A0ABT8GPA7_9BACL|nr:DctP family TRAP transporter solute-binding subunit [Ureibacillus sp. BA0131]MDN4493245.1 DctP family TRAP transporter solute-binding subunit [Ureibacillus sp. BA0131]
MKLFLTGSFITIIILIVLFSYRQSIFSTSTLPYDDEQQGLNEQITISFSHVVAENTPKGIAAEKFKELVEEKSNGRVVVQIYPNSMLYNDENELEALRDNEVQMIAPTSSKVTNTLPNWQVLDLPFIIESNEQLKKVLNGDTSKSLLQELERINVKGLTFWNNGFKQIASTSPIIEVEQFKGQRVRMMSGDILQEQFHLLDAKPIAIPFGQVYSDLKNNIVDAQENTISNIYSKQFHTMENHITLSNHGILAYAVMINEDFWNSLDEEIQTIITDSLEEMQDWQFERAELFNEENLSYLKANPNVNIYELDEQTKNAWKEKLNPIYSRYEKKINSHYLEALLKEIRSN